jgi:hypothetical protein
MRSVDLVLTLLGHPGHETYNAITPTSDQQAPVCQVIVYPRSIAHGKESFQQTVAHELFHCFQVWNIPAGAGENYQGNKWWLEGTATYFSNGLPTANTGGWAAPFDENLPRSRCMTPHENTVFFSTWETRWNGRLIELLELLRPVTYVCPGPGGCPGDAGDVS